MPVRRYSTAVPGGEQDTTPIAAVLRWLSGLAENYAINNQVLQFDET